MYRYGTRETIYQSDKANEQITDTSKLFYFVYVCVLYVHVIQVS